jgi:hypothetical protein
MYPALYFPQYAVASLQRTPPITGTFPLLDLLQQLITVVVITNTLSPLSRTKWILVYYLHNNRARGSVVVKKLRHTEGRGFETG